jgi:hypothetical protein
MLNHSRLKARRLPTFASALALRPSLLVLLTTGILQDSIIIRA